MPPGSLGFQWAWDAFHPLLQRSVRGDFLLDMASGPSNGSECRHNYTAAGLCSNDSYGCPVSCSHHVASYSPFEIQYSALWHPKKAHLQNASILFDHHVVL